MKRAPVRKEKVVKKRKTTAQGIHIPVNALPTTFAKPGFNPEMKAADTNGTIALNNGGAAGHTILLNGLITGPDRYNRIGRKVNVKSVVLRMFIYTSAVAPAVVDDIFRIAVLWDEQPNGALPALADYWSNVSNAGVVTSNAMSLNNQNNSQRFRTLRQETISINAEQQAQDQTNRFHLEWNIPINRITQYNATNGGTIADINTGGIYLVAHGLNSAAAQWSVDVSARCKFFD